MVNKYLPHLALLGANVIYGINYAVAKDVMPTYIEPFGFILLRVLGALSLFWIIHSLGPRERVDKKDFPRLIICGFFGVALNQLLFFKGLNITTPINASIIMTSNPILVLLISSFLLKERISLIRSIGIGIGLIGACTLIFVSQKSNEFGFGNETIWGDIMVLVNAASYGIYLVIAKPLMIKYQPLTVIKWVFCFGSLFVIPIGYDELMQVEWAAMPVSIWGALAYVVIGTTCIAYLCNTFALKTLNASVVSTYIYSQPLFAGIIALSFAKDELTLIKVVSAVLIFIG
ncbi:MAG: DMT family transporter, partial [Flavobacteriales bacterium]|nr:DMT family transporter [Flavobacteriales bacterium]